MRSRAGLPQGGASHYRRLRTQVDSSQLGGTRIVILRVVARPGERIGNYKILDTLGAGGMGEVYRAHDSRLGRDVALKVLQEDARFDAERRSRFEREARAAAGLSHPNIVSVFDIGEHEGCLYIVSELIAGETLRSIVRAGPLPARKLLDIAVQIADGLSAAHAAGITHRDLKPENIMLTPERRAKILDFGIALVTASGDSVSEETRTIATDPGKVVGTISYMSPEQARGMVVDCRSDQFSFGLILYELAGGKHAFARETSMETVTAILREEPAPPPASVPAPLRWIIERCLAKDAGDRYDSTRDLHRDLKDVRDHLSEAYTSGMFAAVPETAARPAPRLRAVVAGLAGALVLAVAVLGLVLWKWSKTGDLTRSTFRSVALGHILGSPLWSPDGRAIAFSETEPGGRPQIWIRYLASAVPVRFTNVPEGAILGGWSPDSLSIYYSVYRDPPPLLKASVAGGQPSQVGMISVPGSISAGAIRPDGSANAVMHCPEGRCTISVSSPMGSAYREYPNLPFAGHLVANESDLKWSPDGSKMLVSVTPASLRTQFWLLPWPPGPPKQVLDQVSATASTIHFGWMPDSRHVVYELNHGDLSYHLWIADTSSSENRQVTTGAGSERYPAASPDGARIAYADLFSETTPVTISLENGAARDTPDQTRADNAVTWAARKNVLAWVSIRNGAPEVWARISDGAERVVASAADFPGERTTFFLSPAPSPDGTRIAFARVPSHAAAKYWVMSLAGGRPVRLTNTRPEANENAGCWSPDGTQFAYTTRPAGLWVVGTGGQAPPIRIAAYDGLMPDWSPDGHWIAASDGEYWFLVSPDGRRTIALPKIHTASLGFSKDSRRVYGIRTDTGMPVLFYIEVANPDKVHDVREIDPVLMPGSPVNPGIRFSVAPDGKSAVYGTYRRHTAMRLLEHFEPPSLMERLGLRWRPTEADLP